MEKPLRLTVVKFVLFAISLLRHTHLAQEVDMLKLSKIPFRIIFKFIYLVFLIVISKTYPNTLPITLYVLGAYLIYTNHKMKITKVNTDKTLASIDKDLKTLFDNQKNTLVIINALRLELNKFKKTKKVETRDGR